MDCYDYNALVFHNNERTPRVMTTELTDSSGSNDLTFFRISGSSVVAGGDALFKLSLPAPYVITLLPFLAGIFVLLEISQVHL